MTGPRSNVALYYSRHVQLWPRASPRSSSTRWWCRFKGGDLFALQSDINIMSMAAGMERTEKQRHELLNSVGLEIVRIWTKDADSESIIEAMLL